MLVPKLLSLVALATSAATATTADPLQTVQPHIVFILADDLGFHDAPWRNPLVFAPALRQLADEGITLDQAYSLPVCSPSRAALLSGRHPYTSGMMYKSIKPLQPTGLPLNLTLLPQQLRDVGYSTHAIGKWHLGFCKEEYTPLRRGFDTFRGFYTGTLGYYSHSRRGSKSKTSKKNNKGKRSKKNKKLPGMDFRDNATPDSSCSGQYSTFEFAKNAQEIIRNRNPEDPMFMYLAFQNPHGPLEAPRRFIERYSFETNPKRRFMLGMISALDKAVKTVVDTLKETGHYNNTIIVFASDNGGSIQKMGFNWPLRGTKSSIFEGGTRVPALIRSSMISHSEHAYQGLFHVTDWYPTLLSAAGVTPPTHLDGTDQWAALRGLAPPPRKQMVYHIQNTTGLKAAMRYENYKIIVGSMKDTGWNVPPEYSGINKTTLKNFLDSGGVMKIEPTRSDDPALILDVDNEEVQISNAPHSVSINKIDQDYSNDEDYEEYDYKLKEEEAANENSTADIFQLRSLMSEMLMNFKAYSDSEQVENREDTAMSKSQQFSLSQLIRELRSKEQKETERFKHEGKQEKEGRNSRIRYNKKDSKDKKKIFNQIRPIKIQPTGAQRVIGDRRHYINAFKSAEDILESGIPVHLYDLQADPYERHNLAVDKPDVVESMLHRLLPELLKYVPPEDPPLSRTGNPSNFDGFWSPGWC